MFEDLSRISIRPCWDTSHVSSWKHVLFLSVEIFSCLLKNIVAFCLRRPSETAREVMLLVDLPAFLVVCNQNSQLERAVFMKQARAWGCG